MLRRQQAFGYTEEDLRLLLAPMAQNGEEAIGSMGTDTSLAVLSNRPRLLFDYFKQLFAQVTNPPLDAIREELITSMASTIGPEGNLLDPRPESCRQIEVKYPILSNEEVAKLRCVGSDFEPETYLTDCDPADESLHAQCPAPAAFPGFRTITLPMLFDPAENGPGLARAMAELCRRASDAVAAGYNILILSDRGVDATRAAIPSLLATAGVHHHLVREGARTKCALVVEAGDAREVHHCALLLGYGAGAVNPYLAFETLDDMIRQGMLPGLTHVKAVRNYIKALNKGILKVMSKMGISTLQSYCGAQIFEAIGLNKDVRRSGTSRGRRRASSGIGIEMVSEEVCRRHASAYPGAAGEAGGARGRAASTSGAATASSTCSTRRRCSSCSTRRAAGSTRSSSSTPKLVDNQGAGAGDAARPDGARAPASRSRSTRSSRWRRSSSASRRARCPTARSAPRRTRRWRSR